MKAAITLKHKGSMVGNIVQWLKAVAAIPEDLGLISNTDRAVYKQW